MTCFGVKLLFCIIRISPPRPLFQCVRSDNCKLIIFLLVINSACRKISRTRISPPKKKIIWPPPRLQCNNTTAKRVFIPKFVSCGIIFPKRRLPAQTYCQLYVIFMLYHTRVLYGTVVWTYNIWNVHIINAIVCSLFAGCWWRPPDSRSRRGAGRVCPSDSPSTYRARAISCCRTRTPTCRPTARPTWTLTSPPACGSSPWTAERYRRLHRRLHRRSRRRLLAVDDHIHTRTGGETTSSLMILLYYIVIFVFAHP